MTQITNQQQWQAAATSVASKFQAFHEGLTRDQQQALDVALRQVGAHTDAAGEDAAGYFSPVWLPLIVVKIVEQLRQESPPPRQPSQHGQIR